MKHWRSPNNARAIKAARQMQCHLGDLPGDAMLPPLVLPRRSFVPRWIANGKAAFMGTLAVALYCAFVFAIFAAPFLLPMATARGQEHHSRHHAHYQNWINKNGKGCCNDNDCGELPPDRERVTRAGLEVRIEGQWCPVLAHHYLKAGNAPNGEVAHVCVVKRYNALDTRPPCERFICYQPRPMT